MNAFHLRFVDTRIEVRSALVLVVADLLRLGPA